MVLNEFCEIANCVMETNLRRVDHKNLQRGQQHGGGERRVPGPPCGRGRRNTQEFILIYTEVLFVWGGTIGGVQCILLLSAQTEFTPGRPQDYMGHQGS